MVQKPRMRDMVADYRRDKLWEDLRGNWVNAAIHRLPAFAVAWGAARLGLSPTALTLASGLIALALPLAAAFLPMPFAAILVCVLGYLFQVLDCADGTLARATGRTSEAGARIDFLIDMAQWGLLYLAIGLLADRTLGTGFQWTALACAAAWMRLYARTVRDALPKGRDEPESRPLAVNEIPEAAIAGISGAIPFLALAGPYLPWAVWALAAYSVLDIATALVAHRHRPS